MDYKMTDADISKALKEESYLDEGHETCGGFRDLVPLLKVLRYKALHSSNVYESTKEREKGVIYPSYWLR
ncbi:hypothetical protein P4E94_14270 [Pontiellaceae bacterium B12219]|jgi:hypothetical protein|nr:hypothetical protein [Pontiellaceae bacterium B12219]